MELVRTDLPIPAYYKLCDHIEKRINDLQTRESSFSVIDNKINEIPISKKTLNECNKLRIKLCEIKQLLEMDNLEKINKDIERLHDAVKYRLS